MEAYALLEALQSALAPEVQALGGELSVQGHEADALAHLMTGVDRWRVCLICGQEDPGASDGEKEGGVVTFLIRALVQHKEALGFEPGASTFKQGASPHAVPLLRRCTQFRLLVMRCQFMRGTPPLPAGDADHLSGWTYGGRRTYAPTADWQSLRTYELTFRCRAGLLTPDLKGADKPIPCLLTS